jgi:polysaccharide pyruvyl transferase WcaK-like protein
VGTQCAYVLFLPTYNVPHEGDDRICEEILRKMALPKAQVLRIEDPALYVAITAQLNALLGGRMHPTIFAASVGTPIVGLAYNQKFHGFFELLGLRSSMLDVDTFVREERTEDLKRLLDTALQRKINLSARVGQLTEGVRRFSHSLMDKMA